MAERLPNKPESFKDKPELHVEAEHLPDIEKLNQEALEKNAEKVGVENLQETVQEVAKRSQEITVESAPTAEKQEFGAYNDLKGQTYGHTLKRIQQRLSKPERAMSKVMHNKTVEKVSDGLGKTAARPSGILGGGIVSLLGSFVLLYMAKKYGFEYNFFIFFALLAVGFGLGVLIDLLIYTVSKARR